MTSDETHGHALSGKRILIVEDDDRLYHALKDALEDFGCEILGTCMRMSGSLDTLPGSYLDAALIDLEQLSIERAASMASRLDARGVPVVLITRELPADLPAALRAQRRLLKPFTEQDLLDGMARAIAEA